MEISKLTTQAEIEAEVRDRWDELMEEDYPEDMLNDWADSQTPDFYPDILQQWGQLPIEDSDKWKDIGMTDYFYKGGIFKLMQVDLALYYEELFSQAYYKVKNEIPNLVKGE